MELKAKLIPYTLLAFNTCTNPEESGKRLGIEREREEADELGLMELKAKPIPRWAASFLDCLKHLHQPRRKQEKRGYREEREREKRQMS